MLRLLNFENSYTKLPEVFFSKVAPAQVADPQMIIFNHNLAQDLAINAANLSQQQLAQIFCGNVLQPNCETLALAYAGHQFGNFVILGDGRAILLGEHLTPNNQRCDIQLKGSGQTPYSRRGDGRAALAPMLREYLISEAMHQLQIPTTRSLAVVATGEVVYRENLLPGAVLARVASSHIRVGTFQLAAALHGKKEVAALLDYTIQRHFPELLNRQDKARQMLKMVINRQADLLVNWLRVGFVHGVMNTDNMLLCGETIDYGPCAFIDEYEAQKVFSSIDYYGRYAFENQPIVAQWNLARLAETLLPFLSDNVDEAREIAEEEIDNFRVIYQQKYLTMMLAKLGISKAEEGDDKMIAVLLELMQSNKIDYTNFFRDLLADKAFAQPQLAKWQQQWQSRRQKNQTIESSKDLMRKNNPVIIPRNHQVNKALADAENGDLSSFQELLSALQNVYQESEDKIPYQNPPKEEEKVLETFCGT